MDKRLDEQINIRDDLFPKTDRPFFMGVVGSRGSGKTSLVFNLLLHHFRQKFNKMYVVSASLHSDEQKMHHLLKSPMVIPNKKLEKAIYEYDLIGGQRKRVKLPPTKLDVQKNFKDTLDEGWFLDIIKDQEFTIKHFGKEKADRILFVFDDLVQHDFFRSKKFLDVSNRLRHTLCSLILISQTYLQIPRQIRLGLDSVILFHTANQRELRTIYEEQGAGLSFQDWMEKFETATAENENGFGGALHIDYSNTRKHRFSIAFKEFI